MVFHGIEKLSLVDFDGHTACTLFTGACNFRCPFCHNASLVLEPGSVPALDTEMLKASLGKRRGLIDAVGITGGEPTLNSDLPDFIAYVKSLGYLVKLDTNGTNPAMLRALIEKSLVDYVAMDIKNSPEMYPKTTGIGNPRTEKVFESARFLINARNANTAFDFEFRTTIVKEFHTEDDFIIIGSELCGAPRYFLQKFEDRGNCIASSLHAVPKEDAEGFAAVLRDYIPEVGLRGYDDD